MKSRTMLVFVAGLLCAALVLPAQGQKIEKRGQAVMTFLLINPSPRAAGMVASNAIEGEAGALFQNPAGIAKLAGQGDVMFAQNSWIADITQNAFAGIYRVEGLGVFGLSWVSMDHGDIYRTTINKDPLSVGFSETGKVNTDESVISLAYARDITDRFTIGGQAKRVAQTLADTRTDGIAFDLGLLYYTGYRGSHLSMSIRNFSKEVQYIDQSSQMPLTFKVGLSLDLLQMGVPQMGEGNGLILHSEISHPRDSPEKVDIGIEYWLQDLVALRVGTGMNYDENNLGAGVGINLSHEQFGDLRLDYAYTGYGDILGSVHRISIGAGF